MIAVYLSPWHVFAWLLGFTLVVALLATRLAVAVHETERWIERHAEVRAELRRCRNAVTHDRQRRARTEWGR